MAWRSHGSTNAELIENLYGHSIIRNSRIKKAMLHLDRAKYVKNNAYMDAPQSIGYGVTISAPHMHAHVLEALNDHLRPGRKALDVGSGSGYLTACMALLVGKAGRAVGIDHIPELIELGTKNVKSDRPDLIRNGRVKLILGDGRLGHEEEAPYNAIHVGAAAVEVPQALINQLAPGGRMIIPVGPPSWDQVLTQVDKAADGTITMKNLMGVMYVPLTDRQTQWSGGSDQ